jgi:hypothetical protein
MGAGGGGAGSVGLAGSVGNGSGGTGIVSSITGSRNLYAGGGGGAIGGGSGGSGAWPTTFGGGGGGGNGGNCGNVASDATFITPTFGLVNTGGGGGGGSYLRTNVNQAGATGGSGIVVIRYPSYLAQAKSTTGSPQTYIAGSWRVYVFVASGTITF